MDIMASMSQGLPAKWTGIIARIRLVMLFSIRLGSIFIVCLSISTKTGLAAKMSVYETRRFFFQYMFEVFKFVRYEYMKVSDSPR